MSLRCRTSEKGIKGEKESCFLVEKERKRNKRKREREKKVFSLVSSFYIGWPPSLVVVVAVMVLSSRCHYIVVASLCRNEKRIRIDHVILYENEKGKEKLK
jgi:hypothetical protein